MKMRALVLLSLGLATLVACEDPYQPTLHPDYRIAVLPTAQGSVAIPPRCPSWNTEISDPFDNQPAPQFGCADARNLAAMVENPNDLVQGRALGDARGVTEVGAIRRYDNNQTRGLITPAAEVSQVGATTSSTATSSLTGDITGGAGTSSSSASSSAAASP